ncbi:MAG: endonuclease, partial [bacterium]
GYTAGYVGTVFEPLDEFKGDIARCLLYFATRYEDQITSWNYTMFNGTSTQVFTNTFINILVTWNNLDPVSPYEIAKNNAVYTFQGNRNPFIDSVRYACYIDFSNMTYIANPTYTTGVNFPCYVASTVGVKENAASHFEYVLAPNPTSGEFYLMIDATVAEKFTFNVTDVSGRIVYD